MAHLGGSFRRPELPNLALQRLVFMSRLLKVGTKGLYLLYIACLVIW